MKTRDFEKRKADQSRKTVVTAAHLILLILTPMLCQVICMELCFCFRRCNFKY